jgi:hypothetical protein
MSQVVELDTRRRLSLARIARAEDERYQVDVEPDGTIILTPVVVMTSFEAALLREPALVKEIQDDLASDRRYSLDEIEAAAAEGRPLAS